MRNSTTSRGMTTLAIAALAVTLLAGTADASSTYSVTTGAYNGTRNAASNALNESSCSGLTTNRLTAIMLSIPVWEVAGGSATYASSPMALSRWDGWSNPNNRPLYSHTEYSHYKRAHWNPGVGLWQLDTWGNSLDLNHAQRANTSVGGLRVARYLRDGYCAGTSTLRTRLNATWYACQGDACWDTYIDMYNSSSDTLNVTLTSGSQWDGGVATTSCRWGSSGSPFTCYIYDVDDHEGQMDMNDPNGDGSRTPLAAGFISLTTSNIKRAAWLRSTTGYDKEIVKAVRTTEGARNSTLYSNGWYDWTTLEVYVCESGLGCWWSTWGP